MYKDDKMIPQCTYPLPNSPWSRALCLSNTRKLNWLELNLGLQTPIFYPLLWHWVFLCPVHQNKELTSDARSEYVNIILFLYQTIGAWVGINKFWIDPGSDDQLFQNRKTKIISVSNALSCTPQQHVCGMSGPAPLEPGFLESRWQGAPGESPGQWILSSCEGGCCSVNVPAMYHQCHFPLLLFSNEWGHHPYPDLSLPVSHVEETVSVSCQANTKVHGEIVWVRIKLGHWFEPLYLTWLPLLRASYPGSASGEVELIISASVE